MNFSIIDKSWSLFLDRDGVINVEKYDNYILDWKEFRFYDGVKEALSVCANKFGQIIVFTNQRGVGKGMHTDEDVLEIHDNMIKAIEKAGGRIDKVYYATSLENDHPLRKPNTGMGLLAKKDFPSIDFSKSIMVGNTSGDMRFGRNLGVACNVLIHARLETDIHDPDIDTIFPDLLSFARALAG
ncbi:D-glycero-alpha-D-manno-heptose-1,7-bisphosphate 7-phosphatase [soil metagenome]